MARHRTSTTRNDGRQRGLAERAAEASAARLAARAATTTDDDCPTPLSRRTSPRRPSAKKSVSAGATGGTGTSPRPPRPSPKSISADNSSQLIAESQSLLFLSPADASATLSVVHENVESQITHGTNFPSDKSESTSDDDDSVPVAIIADNMSNEALLNFFENNENEEEVDRDKMAEGLEDLNDYSSDRFSVNERRHYFMDRAAISSQNRAAVEFVYMVEAETLTRDSGTRGLNDVKALLHSKYIELIRQIPTNHFSEFGLREGMIDKYYGAKKGGASGFYNKVLDVKKKVQAVTRLIDGIGTPLSKIPSGRGINDVKDKFILNDYKAVMGAVSILVSSSFLCLHNIDSNCACQH
jgi:hypothetical protein